MSSASPLDWSKEEIRSAAANVALACLFAVFTILYVAPSELTITVVVAFMVALEAALGALYLRRVRHPHDEPESASLPLVIGERSRRISPWPFALLILYQFLPFAVFSLIGGRIGQAFAVAILSIGFAIFIVFASRHQVQRVTISVEGVFEEEFSGRRTMLRWNEIGEIRDGPYAVALIGNDGKTKIHVQAEGRTKTRMLAAVRAGAPQARVRSSHWS
jgi:hypothetical protein